jgi:starch synthase
MARSNAKSSTPQPDATPQADDTTLRVLFVASEADPLIKVGGLGDVTGSLPRTLRALTIEQTGGYHLDVRLVIPFYTAIGNRVKNIEHVVTFSVPNPSGPIQADAYLTMVDDLPVYLIAGSPIPADSGVYSLDTKKDGEKFTFFSLAVLELAQKLDWKPDILHSHDWHTAISVRMLALRRESDPFFAGARSIFTIHNLPFMGAGNDAALQAYAIPPVQDERLPEWGAYQPLPMALASADLITTVSPTYAREILTPEFGCGLQDFLQARAEDVSGILNGLDEKAWDPSTDSALAVKFNQETLEQRQANKLALLKEFSLPPNMDLPLLILISRMDWQKGVDLALDGLRMVAGLPWQAILLGNGDPTLESSVRQLEAEFPFRVRAAIRFDAQLSRRMYAGGDMLLMPSRYEPCGLAQMIGMRYGCIPVARATGGLRDTVIDLQTPETSTGFLFEESTPEALAAALRRALAAYNDRQGWEARQRFGMRQDFSWERSARTYTQSYIKLHGTPNFENSREVNG